MHPAYRWAARLALAAAFFFGAVPAIGDLLSKADAQFAARCDALRAAAPSEIPGRLEPVPSFSPFHGGRCIDRSTGRLYDPEWLEDRSNSFIIVE